MILTLPQGWRRDPFRSQASGSTDIFLGPISASVGEMAEPQLLVKSVPTPEETTNFQAIAVALKQQQLTAGGGEVLAALTEATLVIDGHPARLDAFTYRDQALQSVVMQCQGCIQRLGAVCIVMGIARTANQADYLPFFKQVLNGLQFTDNARV